VFVSTDINACIQELQTKGINGEVEKGRSEKTNMKFF